MAEFYLVAPVSGSWYCSCCLNVTLSWLPESLKWNRAIVNVIIYTCALPTMRSQNVCSRKSRCYISPHNPQDFSVKYKWNYLRDVLCKLIYKWEFIIWQKVLKELHTHHCQRWWVLLWMQTLITFQILISAWLIKGLHHQRCKAVYVTWAWSVSCRASVKLHRRQKGRSLHCMGDHFQFYSPRLVLLPPLISCTITFLDEGLIAGVIQRTTITEYFIAFPY